MAAEQHRLLFAPGDRVGRYEIVAEVAQGGMATVYVARLRSIGGFDKLYALKVLLPHLRANTEFVHMLLDEARIAASIQHPNVVQVVDVADAEGTPYIAMELLRGRSLRRLDAASKAAGDRLPPGLVLGVLGRAARGLHAAHEAKDRDGKPLGVVHRDVSPENIHVGFDGHVKVLDFGIAAAKGRLTETAHGVVKGKARYLAPEQLTRIQSADRRVDVWAIGVMAHELLAGQKLFADEDMSTTMWNVLHREVPDLRELAPDIPDEVSETVARALCRDVDGRAKSCDEVAAAFERGARVLGGGGIDEARDYLARLLGGARVEEEAKMAEALRTFVQSTRSEVVLEDGDVISSEVRPKRRGYLGVTLGLVAAAAIVGAGLAWTGGSGGEPPGGAAQAGAAAVTVTEAGAEAVPPVTEADPALDPAPVPVAEPAVATTTITVGVDARARLVLVDGERSDARPLLLTLGPSDSHVVELYGPRGESSRHEVGPGDDGVMLGFGASRRRRAAARAAVSTSAETAGPSRDILRNVF